MVRVQLSFLFIVALSCVTAFDLNDPKTNLDSFVRVGSSSNPDVTTIVYANGTIYARLPFQKLRKLFSFDGYDIGRKIYTRDGYLSLTREVFVYRDLQTREIIDVSHNVFSQRSNEVFHVHNDPIDFNMTYGNITPTVRFPNHGFAFLMDIFLQYPNSLDPIHYSKYSAGPIYQSDELFQYFSDYDVLSTTNVSSLNMTGVWMRRSQFLPWMEMGDTPGHLYYMTTNWKCLNGLGDIPSDLLNFVKSRYPEYLKAPTSFRPNPVTSWEVFKKVIDYRRAHKMPDIIFPMQKISTQTVPKVNSLDPRLVTHFSKEETYAFLNGSIYSEITGRQTVQMFKFTGMVRATTVSFGSQTVSFHMQAVGDYRNPITQQVMTSYRNPFTNRTVLIPKFNISEGVLFQRTDVISMPVPHFHKLSLQALTSSIEKHIFTVETWSVNMLNIIFKESDLENPTPFFSGTWVRFCSWPEWLKMGVIKGDMVSRLSINRIVDPKFSNIALYDYYQTYANNY